MARDILGPSQPMPGSGGQHNGGIIQPRDVMNYQPPMGPSNINDPKSPGLHGENCGNCGTQGKR